MRVLITTQVFPPEIHPTAVMVKELAETMSGRGWEVTVAAGYPHHPHGRLYPGFQQKWAEIRKLNGFQVVRARHLVNPSSALATRALVMASQGAGFLVGALKASRPELVISVGPPVLGPLASAVIARIQGARLVTVIYDLYPDIAVASGNLRSPVLIQAAKGLERLVYRASDQIVVLSEGFRRTLVQEKGVAPGKVAVIPVWLDGQEIVPRDRDNSWRQEMGIGPEKFVVLYAGTIGLVSGAEVLVEAARQLQSQQDILLLLVGEGRLKDRVAELAREAGLENLRFLPFQPRERLGELQASADISLVTLAPGRGRTSVPSKVLGYMAAARPVIASVDAGCDTAELIGNAGCGLVTPPGDAGSLARAVLHLYKHPELRRQMGLSGREYFEQNLERRRVLARYVAILEKIAANS